MKTLTDKMSKPMSDLELQVMKDIQVWAKVVHGLNPCEMFPGVDKWDVLVDEYWETQTC